MSKEEALKIVLIDVCCSNGKDFCELCPINEESCENIHYNEEQLIESIKILRDN